MCKSYFAAVYSLISMETVMWLRSHGHKVLRYPHTHLHTNHNTLTAIADCAISAMNAAWLGAIHQFNYDISVQKQRLLSQLDIAAYYVSLIGSEITDRHQKISIHQQDLIACYSSPCFYQNVNHLLAWIEVESRVVLFILRVALPKNAVRRAACGSPERSEGVQPSERLSGAKVWS